MTNEEFKQYIKNRGADNALFDAKTSEQTQLALNAGANVNARNTRNQTALMYAADEGHTEIAKLLIEKGADVNARDNDGWTPLMYAADEGRTEMGKLLIEKGADVNARDNNGETILIYAAEHGAIDIARLLNAKLSKIRNESRKQEQDPAFRAKLAAAKERLKSKPKTKSVSGVVIADKIADMIRSGKIKGDVTPEKGKKLSAQIKKEIMMGKKDR